MIEEKNESKTKNELSEEIIPLLPLRGMVVFPDVVLPLDVGREPSVNAVETAMLKDRIIVLSAQKDAKKNDPKPYDIYDVGTMAQVKQLLKLPDGTIRILVEGLCRVKIQEYIQSTPYFLVKVVGVDNDEYIDLESQALVRSTVELFEQYAKYNKKTPPELLTTVNIAENPGRLADVVASHLNLKLEEKQMLLKTALPKERLEAICRLLTREIDIIELERKIQARVRKQMEKTQKDYYLREQMKAIQKELGEGDERAVEVAELRAKVEEIDLPEEAEEKALKELDRLAKMPPLTAEAVVVRNYLDWILSLPWNIFTKDSINVKKAAKILDEDHYGLEKVKERILEYLAVCQLTKEIKGPILCLVGPPGVGKTSLAKSVARALGRKFVRFSLGGVRDEAEIRGHRRTYVGAMPGKIIQLMKKAAAKNPVILLDEIDKMSTDFRGDPTAALLEVLDPEQNNSFGDHYLELPFDLSKVLFITTANSFHDIPRPLLDRMEVITVSGYTELEKLQIAKRYLLPKQLKENGLTTKMLHISDAMLSDIVNGYTKESGVRSLERQIAKVCRKTAKEIAEKSRDSVRLTKKDLEKFLGAPRFHHNMAEKFDQTGLATGLAWTEVGGDILSIEVSPVRGKGNLILTGQLGEVMRESAQAAFSYIRSRAKDFGVAEDFYEHFDLHIHVPEGAIPKDGPSAGITIATAILSALTERPVRKEVAMTGEITLRGRILPIGGLKEKMLAAHRSGIKTVLVPKENAKDLEEIPQEIISDLKVVLVDTMDQVWNETLLPTQIQH